MSRRRFLADRCRPVTAATMHGDRAPDIVDQNHLDAGARAWLAENDRSARGAPSPERTREMQRRLTPKGKRS
jgi:hypothetical protein